MKTLMVLILGFASSWAADYELLLEDPDIFSPCTEPPPGSIGFLDAFDIGNLVLDQDADIIHLSESITSNWDVEPTDRISARFALMHYNRGSWEPTIFSMATPDFCASMFDENQSWFKYWTKHISNRDEVMEKCFKTPGTVLNHNPFDLQLRLTDIRGATLRGRYKAVVTFEAVDERDVPRRNSICFEIRGEAEKIN
ncbi:uncharacterized protein LOC6528345 [Drosophila yakuba]|uniref:Uncharacterized protein n=1 Tax=Drosophila yakuba TaxID=7245 RepID=B4P1A8_DROYA|nr:uncharacterized protein LOC6528345 [Drosophila yakuba]EDW89110.1 uncharacterized protein Dyak_GE24346 [Drosophila yakuba]